MNKNMWEITKSLPINSRQMLLLLIGILIVILVYANNRIDSIQNQQQQIEAPLDISEAKFPVQTLDLRKTSWESNTFSGSITNNGTQDIFNATIKLAVSKSRNEWIPEDEFLTIPYKIKAGETIKFSETMPSYGSSNWWSSYIVDARYYNGEQVPTPPVINQQNSVLPTIDNMPTVQPQTRTPTPNLGKKLTLEFILKKIEDINKAISAWQSQIENLRSQFQKTCDAISENSIVTPEPEFNSTNEGLHYPAQVLNPMIREQAVTNCYRRIAANIKEIDVKIDTLVRERGEFERQALQLIAQ